MTLIERLSQVRADIARVRESLQIVVPGQLHQEQGRESADLRGYRQIRQSSRESIAALAALLVGVKEGRVPSYMVQEAMSVSDFPYLYGDLMNRQMLGNYVPYPITYPSYFRILEPNDLRVLYLQTLEGGTDSALKKLKEYEPYPEVKFREGRYQVQAAKYGRRYGISFEMVINDDLNAMSSRPTAMALGARRAEELLATQQLCDVNGPHATFFSSGNGNIATGALTIPNLQLAFKLLKEKRDSDGEPIVIDMVHLVTTPANEITAMNILSALEIRTTDEALGGSATNMLISTNWMKSRLQLSINPYIPIVASSCATEPWFLIASPTNPANRPAFIFAFLRGRRNPQLFVKDPDASLLGGGDSGPLEGSFDNDSIDYKLRHLFGAAQADPNMAVASFG